MIKSWGRSGDSAGKRERDGNEDPLGNHRLENAGWHLLTQSRNLRTMRKTSKEETVARLQAVLVLLLCKTRRYECNKTAKQVQITQSN